MIKFIEVEGGVLVSRPCILDGERYDHLIKGATEAQILAWSNGTHVQDALPNSTAEDREFLISGITPAHWDDVLGEEPA